MNSGLATEPADPWTHASAATVTRRRDMAVDTMAMTRGVPQQRKRACRSGTFYLLVRSHAFLPLQELAANRARQQLM